MTWPKHTLTLVFLCALVLASGQWGCASQAAQSPSPSATQPALATQPAPETPTQLQQLVAPIALYPDELVAQILAASTYPDQIVEADRWLQQHTNLKGDQLMTAVDTTTLGSQCEGAHTIPLGPRKSGQKPLLDLGAR